MKIKEGNNPRKFGDMWHNIIMWAMKVACHDSFGGTNFEYSWNQQPHAWMPTSHDFPESFPSSCWFFPLPHFNLIFRK